MLRRLIIPIFLASVVPLQGQQAPVVQTDPCPSADAATSSNAGPSEKGKKKDSKAPLSTPETPCAPAREPSAAEKFPFPGSSSAPAMPGASQPSADAPSTGRPKSAAEEHPFPGNAPPMPGSDSSSSSSSSSSDGDSSSNDGSASSDAPKDEPKPDTRAGRRRLPKVEKLQSDEDRVEEDLKVAQFYEGKGVLNAAYLRLQDAVKSLPNDSENHYALARMAQKMNKRDEAIAEYHTYIKLEPDGENVSKAQKALNQLETK
jgi:tetratricopeptide (TPR) repeat protein